MFNSFVSLSSLASRSFSLFGFLCLPLSTFPNTPSFPCCLMSPSRNFNFHSFFRMFYFRHFSLMFLPPPCISLVSPLNSFNLPSFHSYLMKDFNFHSFFHIFYFPCVSLSSTSLLFLPPAPPFGFLWSPLWLFLTFLPFLDLLPYCSLRSFFCMFYFPCVSLSSTSFVFPSPAADFFSPPFNFL